MMLAFIPLLLFTFLQVYCACPDGFYSNEGKCKKCPDTCSTCETKAFCKECKNGYYGHSCSSRCNPHCRNGSCSKLSKFCSSCEDGYFLDTSQNCVSCPPGCLVCSDDNECSACKVGFKGSRCDERCVNCKSGTACNKMTGNCFTCEDGLTGLMCEQKCNPKCRSCQRIDKNACISCAPNTKGENCEFRCPTNCADSVCFDGSCQLRCSEGYWGKKCEHQCSTNCLGQLCERNSGVCIHNCTGNFTDGICNCPNQCICDNDGKCLHCNESSGLNCGPPCSEVCKGQYCNRDTGRCLDGCKDNYKGLRCDDSYARTYLSGNTSSNYMQQHKVQRCKRLQGISPLKASVDTRFSEQNSFNDQQESEKVINNRLWLIGSVALPVEVIVLVMICRSWIRRKMKSRRMSVE